jgi:hypothetical protein
VDVIIHITDKPIEGVGASPDKGLFNVLSGMFNMSCQAER